MDRPTCIKQEPFFEENGKISSAGKLPMSARPVTIKTENDTFCANPTLSGPSIKPDPEPLGLLQSRDAPTNHVLQGAGNEDVEQEESLSDEGIGRSPAPSEYIIHSHSEEETSTSSAGMLDPAEGLVSETRVHKELFSCDQCGMAFTDKSHLLRHMKVHTFICQYCGMQFISDLKLLEHEDAHRGGQEYECDECNIIFNSKDDLEEHYGNHIYACSLCPRTFINSIALLNHQQSHQYQNLSCTNCGKIFKRLSNLSVHKQKFCPARKDSSSYHEGKPKISAKNAEIGDGGDKMEESANIDDGWEEDDETAEVETVVSPKRGSDMYFHCSKCPQAFSNREDFVRHELNHPGPSKPITSDTVQPSDAYVSQESVTYSNGFECKDCETTYTSLAALQRHSLKHIYPCNLCDKTFTNLKKLKKHVRSHNQVFKCPKCPQQFKMQHFLKSHMEKVHSLSGNRMAAKGSASSVNASSNPTKEARPIVKLSSNECILGNQVVQEDQSLNPSQITSKGGKSSLKPSSHPTKEAKSIMKSSSGNFILGNQIVQKHHSPNPSHSSPRDSFSSWENIGNDKQEPERQQESSAVLEESSAKASLVYKCSICEKAYARKCDLTMHMKRGKHGHPCLHSSSELQKELSSDQEHTNRRESSREQPSGRSFKCSLCPKTFSKKYNLAKHMKLSKHKNAGFVRDRKRNGPPGSEFHCKVCSETFALQQNLTDHMKRKHPQLKSNKSRAEKLVKVQSLTFQCRTCSQIFFRKCDLTRHMRRGKHHIVSQQDNKDSKTGISRPFKCTECPKAYYTKCHLREHFRHKHRQESSRKQSLNSPSSSSKGISRKSDLSMHMQQGKHQMLPQEDSEHSKTGLSRPFKCTKCPKAYFKKFHLQEHFKLKHLQEVGSIKQMLNPPSNSTTFNCRVCSKIFPSLYGLSVHMKLGKHQSNSVIQCRVCSIVFKQKRYLTQHMKRKHPDLKRDIVTVEAPKKSKDVMFPCKSCKKTFCRKIDLTMHMRRAKHENTSQQAKYAIVIRERPQKNYKCGICQLEYVHNSHLRRHIRLKHPNLRNQAFTKSSSSPSFKCKICFKFFAHRRYLRDHARRKHPEIGSNYSRVVEVLQVSQGTEFHCRMCPKSFHTKCGFTKHMARHHQPAQGKVKSVVSSEFGLSKLYKCNECPRSYGTKDLLQRHLMLKHPDSIDQNTSTVSSHSLHRCKVCSKTFSRLYDLKVHMKLKHISSVLKKTMKLNSSQSLGIPCSICPKVFAHKRYLADHMKRKHPEESPCIVNPLNGPLKPSNPSFSCPMCSKKYVRKYDLNVHLRLKHQRTKDVIKGGGPDLSQSKMHTCTKCPNSYKHRFSLLRHIREKHPLLQCQKCPKSFAHKRYLTLHMKYKHPKALNPKSAEKHLFFKCPQCPKSFSRQYDLSRHLKKTKHKYSHNRSSVGEAPAAGSHQCPQCPKSFPTKYGLTMHMALGKHSSVKDWNKHLTGGTRVGNSGSVYQCKKCSIAFTRQCDLTLHMKFGRHLTKESAEDFFQCPKCPRCFTRKDRLLIHMKNGDHIPLDAVSKNNGKTEGKAQGESAFKCSACSKSFAKKGYLSMHLIFCKQQIPQDQSEEGTADEVSGGPLSDRKKTETVEPQNQNISAKSDSLQLAWKCPECGKQFANRCDLKRHQDTHVFMCNHCNRFFTTQNSLNEHACDQRKEAPISHPVVSGPPKPTKNPKMVYKCELCRKSFSSSKNLEKHQEQHTLNEFEEGARTSSTRKNPVKSPKVIPERILLCRFCDKAFSSLELVHKHERSHFTSM